MKPLSEKLKTVILYTATVFNGLVFVFAVWVMANDYKPFVSDKEMGQAMNAALKENISVALRSLYIIKSNDNMECEFVQPQMALSQDVVASPKTYEFNQFGGSLLLPLKK